MQEQRPKRQRSCISCGSKSDKVSLYRIVRSSDGSISFDAGGRMPGRGAYVCSSECLHEAVSGRKLQRSLKMNVSVEDAERVAADVESVIASAKR